MMGGPDQTDAAASLIEQLDRQVNRDDGQAEIWPDMANAVEIFAAMLTQWTVGSGGVIGLRYESLGLLMDAHGIDQTDRRALIADLQIMEHAAIESLRHGQ